MFYLDNFQSSWSCTEHCEEPTDSPPGLDQSLGIGSGDRVRTSVLNMETLTAKLGLEKPCAWVDAPNAKSNGGVELERTLE